MTNENERAKDGICISLLLLVWFGLISGRDIDVVVVVVGGFTLIEHKTNVCVPIQDPNTI